MGILKNYCGMYCDLLSHSASPLPSMERASAAKNYQFMKALITLNGLPAIDAPKNLINIECNSEAQLIAKLKELQIGYSIDGKDRPRIKKHNVPSKKYPGKMRKVIDCLTHADWHHVAHINVSSPNVPTETII